MTSQTNIDSKKKHLAPPNINVNNQHQNYVDEKERLKEIKYSSAYDLGSISSHLSKTQVNDLHLKQHEQSPRINPSINKRLPTSASLTQLSKSSRDIHELTDSISSEQQLLARITNVPSYHSRASATSSISSNQYLKSSRNIDERESLVKTPNEPPNYSRLPSSQRLKSPRSINDMTTSLPNSRDSSVKMSREPMPSRITRDPIGPLTGEQELLARITGETSYRSPSSSSSATSLTPLGQRTKFPRNTNDLMNSSINERETFNKISSEPLIRPRLTPKSIRSSNEPSNTSPRAPIEPLSRPKSAARSNPKISPPKSIYDQVYNSAYGTTSSDDF